ncbi:hypothetical protein D3C77_381250 [compost metagenome]
MHTVAPNVAGFELYVGGQFEWRDAIPGHVLPVTTVRLFPAFHPGKGATGTPALIVGQPVGAAFDTIDPFFGACQDQTVVEALHIPQFRGGVEQRQRRQGLLAQRTAPAQLVIVGFHRFQIRRVDIEPAAGIA